MMLDQATTELLSRHMDGELAASEELQLQQLLAEQPALQQELEAMLELRDSVRAFARQEEPPAELSALLEPLRRSPPPPVTIRPFYRWLAAAAALGLGITVSMEVAQRNPGPTLDPPSTSISQESQEPFQLQPLPTPRDGELVGAIDHLLANPPPGEQLESPPPLEVIGPVEKPPPGNALPAAESPATPPHAAGRVAKERTSEGRTTEGRTTEDRTAGEPAGSVMQSRAQAAPEASAVVSDPTPVELEESEAFAQESVVEDRFADREHHRDEPGLLPVSEDETAVREAETSPHQARRGEAKRVGLLQRGSPATHCVLVLQVAEQRLEVPCRPADPVLAGGTYRVRVTVTDGDITRLEVLQHDGDETADRLSRACSRFTGRSLDLGDGTYTSLVIVHP